MTTTQRNERSERLYAATLAAIRAAFEAVDGVEVPVADVIGAISPSEMSKPAFQLPPVVRKRCHRLEHDLGVKSIRYASAGYRDKRHVASKIVVTRHAPAPSPSR